MESEGKLMNWNMINGVEMNAAHPETFEIPDETDRNNIGIGEHVKIGVQNSECGERFWVQVEHKTDDNRYVGRVNNHLINFPEIAFNSELVFGPEHVLTVIK